MSKKIGLFSFCKLETALTTSKRSWIQIGALATCLGAVPCGCGAPAEDFDSSQQADTTTPALTFSYGLGYAVPTYDAFTYGLSDPATWTWIRADDGVITTISTGVWSHYLEEADETASLKFCLTPPGQTTPLCTTFAKPGATVDLYSNEFYGGDKLLIPAEKFANASCIDLTTTTLNDRTQSLKSHFKEVFYYTGPNCSGDSHVLNTTTPVPDPYLVPQVGNSWGSTFSRSISSIRAYYKNELTINNLAINMTSPTLQPTYTLSDTPGLSTSIGTVVWNRTDDASGTNTATWFGPTHALTLYDENRYFSACISAKDELGFTASQVCSPPQAVGHLLRLYADPNLNNHGTKSFFPFEHLANGTCINLAGYGLDESVSSLTFAGTAGQDKTIISYHKDADCTGVTGDIVVGPEVTGAVADFTPLGFNDQISSVRVIWPGQLDTSRTYTIAVKYDNKCISVPGSNNGTGAIQGDCLGSNDQKWRLADAGDGYYYLIDNQSNKCLGISGYGAGTQATQWDCLSHTDQQWALLPDGNGYYRLVSRNSGMCLDIYQSLTQNGAPFIQWHCSGTDNEALRFTPQ